MKVLRLWKEWIARSLKVRVSSGSSESANLSKFSAARLEQLLSRLR